MNIALIIIEPNVMRKPVTMGAAIFENCSIARIIELNSGTFKRNGMYASLI